jgi:hypothetical protein
MVSTLQLSENTQIRRARRRAEERGQQTAGALQQAPEAADTQAQQGVSGPHTPASISNVSSTTLKKDEIEAITIDVKSELQQDSKKLERKETMGMETLLKPEESEPLYESDHDWANQSSTSSFPFLTKAGKTLSPSYMPTILLQQQVEAFNPEPPITTKNFSSTDVVRFGGISPTPAKMLQIDEARESAMNLSLQIQMEVDFETVSSPSAQGHMEAAIQSIVSEPASSMQKKAEEVAEQAILPTSFKHEIPVETEEFTFSKTYLKKSKKAQKKLGRLKQ